jgi:hypothetical protein
VFFVFFYRIVEHNIIVIIKIFLSFLLSFQNLLFELSNDDRDNLTSSDNLEIILRLKLSEDLTEHSNEGIKYILLWSEFIEHVGRVQIEFSVIATFYKIVHYSFDSLLFTKINEFLSDFC